MSVTAAHLPVGSTLAAKYRVEALLGQGGMGAVYLAENLDIGRKVAIKVLHPEFAADPQTVQRFRMEARAARRRSAIPASSTCSISAPPPTAPSSS